MTLDEAIAELFRREINCGCETFFDAGIRLWISNQMDDRRAETQLSRGHFASRVNGSSTRRDSFSPKLSWNLLRNG